MRSEEEYENFYLVEASDDRRLERIEEDAKLCEHEIDWKKYKKEKINDNERND